jgi:hypothetical protein
MADLLHERNFHDLRRFISTPFLAAKMERVRKGVTPREIVYEEDSSWIPWQRPCGVSPVGLSHVEAHRQPDRKAHQPDGKHPPGRIRRHVFPPAVLGSLQNDVLLVWNSAFQKTVGLSQDELARTPLTSVLILEENQRNPILRDHDAERDNQLLPCALRNSLTNVRGQALRCDDGMLLAMLDVTLGDLVSVGFNQGRRMGCEEERNRTRHFFHHVLELQNTCSLLSGARDSSKASRKRSRRSWKHG